MKSIIEKVKSLMTPRFILTAAFVALVVFTGVRYVNNQSNDTVVAPEVVTADSDGTVVLPSEEIGEAAMPDQVPATGSSTLMAVLGAGLVAYSLYVFVNSRKSLVDFK